MKTTYPVIFFPKRNHQLMVVNWWFGSWWFGFLGSLKMKGIVMKGVPNSNPRPQKLPLGETMFCWGMALKSHDATLPKTNIHRPKLPQRKPVFFLSISLWSPIFRGFHSLASFQGGFLRGVQPRHQDMA